MKLTPQALSTAVNASYAKFAHYRKNRGKFLAQMVGRFYRKSKSVDREEYKASPLNLLHTAVSTLVPNLVFNDPRVRVTTNVLAFRDYADLLELATNHLITRTRLREELRKAVFDAIFLAGFIKTGIAEGDQFVTIDGVDIVLGQPYAERVDPDDMILDPMARAWDEQNFVGNRYRADLDDLIESGLYDEEILKALTSRYEQNEKGKAEGVDGTSVEDQYREVVRYVDLVELYLPRERRVVTLPWSKDMKFDRFMRDEEYNGPDTGPYHMLGFTEVSDNILPVAPAGIWYDLHIQGNKIARKLTRQAERLKRVVAYESSAEEDMNQLADADDGESVRVEDINKIKEVNFGGADDKGYEWMEWVKRQFSEQAGSIELLSGVGTNAPTATQAEMLQANTSVRLSDMQSAVYHFAAEVARDLAFYLHTDPLIELPLIKRTHMIDPATGRRRPQDVQVIYSPEMREGNFLDFTFKTKPYSMARPDPNMAVRRKMEFATNAIPAAAQAFMLLGPGFKIGAFLKQLATDVGLDEADEWLDDLEFQEWMMQKLQASLMSGDPGKAGGAVAMPVASLAGPPVPAINPNQPNPAQMGPSGGITPETERAMAQQETAAELQRGGREPSARAMAMAR